MRSFAGIDLGREAVPDATTLLKFRHLLERHGLTQGLFAQLNAHLGEKGLLMREGTIVDATIIAAPSSTRNKTKERDPEMHQTKKGNEWHFGMKAHVGVDMGSGLVHSLTGTAANVADIAQSHELLHGEEKHGFVDAGCIGVDKREEILARFARVRWHIAARRGRVKAMAQGQLKELTRALEKAKAQVRALVEHPFHVLKNLFGHRKLRCRGLSKNTARLHSLFALANLLIAKRAYCERKPAREQGERAKSRKEIPSHSPKCAAFFPSPRCQKLCKHEPKFSKHEHHPRSRGDGSLISGSLSPPPVSRQLLPPPPPRKLPTRCNRDNPPQGAC